MTKKYASWDTTGAPLGSVEDIGKQILRLTESHRQYFLSPKHLGELLLDYPVFLGYKLLCAQPIRWHCSAFPEGYTLEYSYSIGERYVIRGADRNLSVLLHMAEINEPNWEMFDIGSKRMAYVWSYSDMDEFNKILHEWFCGDMQSFGED